MGCCISLPSLPGGLGWQRAQLATSSDYAAARGKRGGGERRLCTCTAHRIETTEHVVLECELYAAQREPLTEAITEWSAAMQGLSAQEAAAPLTPLSGPEARCTSTF